MIAWLPARRRTGPSATSARPATSYARHSAQPSLRQVRRPRRAGRRLRPEALDQLSPRWQSESTSS
eukprot:4531886-Alexandrium_andersonii.AAC.1